MLPATGARTEARIEGTDAGGGETLMTSDTLIEEINAAYRRLSAAMEDLARADRELTEHVRRVRLDNAETILEARNERTASLYLDGLLTPRSIAAWRTTERGRSSTSSTQGARSSGCT